MCWGEPWLGFGCAGRKEKNGEDDDHNNGDSKKSWKVAFPPFFQNGKKDKDVEKGIYATKSTSTNAGPAYDATTIGTLPTIQTKAAPTDIGRWSNVDSVLTWKIRDRAAMYWAKLKGDLLSVACKFEKKSRVRIRVWRKR
jgi:hypothetical protein